MPDTKPIAVGDVLWFTSSASWLQFVGPITINRVGTKWATFPLNGLDYRIDKRTGRPEGTHWSVWESEAAHQRHVDIGAAWRRLRERISNKYVPPAGITAAEIQAALALLRLDS